MKILHNNKRILAQLKDSEWADWSYFHTRIDENGKYWIINLDGSDNVHVPLDLISTPEDEANKIANRDILYTRNQVDNLGLGKYEVVKGVIKPKVGWVKLEEI